MQYLQGKDKRCLCFPDKRTQPDSHSESTYQKLRRAILADKGCKIQLRLHSSLIQVGMEFD